MTDQETLDVYDAKASEYAERFGRSEPDGDLKRFLDLLKPNSHVLDLGCGPGHASAHMRDAGHRPDPVDASAEMVAYACKTFDLDARQATFDDIPKTPAYDAIWANFSLLHAGQNDVAGYIKDCANALHIQGHFHIGMKTGRGQSRDAIGRRYCYFTTKELINMITDAGLRILTKREGEEPGLSDQVSPYVILQAIKYA